MWEIVPVGEFSAHQPWLSADAGGIFNDIGVLTKRPAHCAWAIHFSVSDAFGRRDCTILGG
jgi:hypothetical protein